MQNSFLWLLLKELLISTEHLTQEKSKILETALKRLVHFAFPQTLKALFCKVTMLKKEKTIYFPILKSNIWNV